MNENDCIIGQDITRWLTTNYFSKVLTVLSCDVYVIPHSEKEGTKPPYVCTGCSHHKYSNNMITRFHVQ
jgi:hypothetical protein